MFKITAGTVPNTYTITCYFYISEVNFYSFLYSAKNIPFDFMASLLQGRLKKADDIDWIPAIVGLANQPAIVGDNGELRAVPLYSKKEPIYEREVTYRETKH